MEETTVEVFPLNLSTQALSASTVTKQKCASESDGSDTYSGDKERDTNKEAIYVGSTLSPEDAHKIIKESAQYKILTKRLQGEIKMNSVYLFDTSQSDVKYWMDDGKQWKYGYKRAVPVHSDKKILNQRHYRLRNDGQTENSYRKEFWDVSGDESRPTTWDPQVVLVYYSGTFPINESKNAPHGNKGRKNTVKNIHNPSTSTFARKRAQSTFVDLSITSETVVESLPSPKMVHGESKKRCTQNGNAGFLKTPATTRQAIVELVRAGMKPAAINTELNLAEIYCENGEFRSPRNKKVIENVSQSLKAGIPQRKDDLGDVYSFALDHPAIVRRFEIIPGLVVVQRHPDLEAHFTDIYRVVPYVTFFYDTTFNVGDRFISTLSVRHPGLLKFPVYPISLLYHEFTDKDATHSPFFRTVASDFRKLNTKKTIIVTDRELSIKGAVAELLPKANHIFCYLHILKNIDRWTASKGYSKKNRTKLHYDVKMLLWSKSMSSYDGLMAKFSPEGDILSSKDPEPEDDIDEIGNIKNKSLDFEQIISSEEMAAKHEKRPRSPWDVKFQKYYMRYLDEDVRKCFRGVVEKYGIFNLNSGITTNPAESVNCQLKHSVLKQTDSQLAANEVLSTINPVLYPTPCFDRNVRNPTLYSIVNRVHNFQTSQLLEIQKAFSQNEANQKLTTDFESKRDKLQPIQINKLITRPIKEFDLKTMWEQDVNYPTKKEEAKLLIQNNLVDFVKNGKWMVTDRRDINISWLVNFPAQTCGCHAKTRCTHILAVNILVGVEGNPNFENLNFVKSNNLTHIYHNHVDSKVSKKGPTRIPVEYVTMPDCVDMDESMDLPILENNPTETCNLAVSPADSTARTIAEVARDPAKDNLMESFPKSLQKLPRIPWGGRIKFGDIEKPLSQTCSLDNIMQILYVLFKTSKASENYIGGFATIGIRDASALLRLFRLIDGRNFDAAKKIWITKFMKLSSADFSGKTAELPVKSEEANLEKTKFLNPVIETRTCHNPDCSTIGDRVIYPMADWMVRYPQMYEAQFNTVVVDERCDAGECTTESPQRSYSFQNGPPAFLMYAMPTGGPRGTEVRPSEVPDSQKILGTKYNLFAFTVHRGNTELSEHFYTVFRTDKTYYKYDGLNPKQMDLVTIFPKGHRVSTVWMLKAAK